MKVSQLAPLIGLVLFVPQVSDAADDVLVWYQGYSDQWRDPNAIEVDAIMRYFAVPRYVVSPQGTAQALTSQEESRARVSELVDNLKRRGWSRTEVTAKAHALAPGVALIEAGWTVLDSSGKPLGNCRGLALFSYVAMVFKEGWKLVSSQARPCMD